MSHSENHHDDEAKIDFGFKTVNRDEKVGLVRDVFDSVADNYDLMNDAMSLGIHRLWKSVLLDRLNPQPGQVLIDVAGGTGDIANGFLSRAQTRDARASRQSTESSPARAIVCDINHAMLAAGQTRAQDASHSDYPYNDQISRVCGNAERLPFPDRYADAYTIGFGIRNVTDRDAALREAYRVLKPGGRFICLEFSRPILASLEKIYDQYSFSVIPWLGEKIVDDRESYEYLVESIRKFPTQDAFAQQISQAGFSRVTIENLSGGIAALHLAWRL